MEGKGKENIWRRNTFVHSKRGKEKDEITEKESISSGAKEKENGYDI